MLPLPSRPPPPHLHSPPPRLVAVDLQPMAPIEGVIQLQGDITAASTAAAIVAALGGGGGGGTAGRGEAGGDEDDETGGASPSTPSTAAAAAAVADLVICDGAPDVTGLHDMDEFVQAQLVLAATALAARVLRPGGALVAKVFRGREAGMLCARLGAFFADVSLAKPRASRAASVEAFVVCRGFSLPAGAEDAGERLWGVLAGGAASGAAGEAADAAAAASGGGATTTTTTDDAHAPASRLPPPTPQARRLVPFVACGDLSGWDADMGYDLDGFDDSKKLGPDNAEGTASKPALLSPVAPPTEPAYAGALRREGRW